MYSVRDWESAPTAAWIVPGCRIVPIGFELELKLGQFDRQLALGEPRIFTPPFEQTHHASGRIPVSVVQGNGHSALCPAHYPNALSRVRVRVRVHLWPLF